MEERAKDTAAHREIAPRVLILGGTGEAFEIAARLSMRMDVQAISSLAGWVRHPKQPDGIVRIGGFGGVDGLSSYLAREHIAAVIDATHPFAEGISRNAKEACLGLRLPLIIFARKPWRQVEGDRWHEVADMHSAATFIAARRGRVFLTIGRQGVGAFNACEDTWFLIRSVDKPEGTLPDGATLVLDRGPFDLVHELQLMRDHQIDCVVSKNSGGSATYSKIEAARQLGIPVVMIRPPLKHGGEACAHIDEVLASLNRLLFDKTNQGDSR